MSAQWRSYSFEGSEEGRSRYENAEDDCKNAKQYSAKKGCDVMWI